MFEWTPYLKNAYCRQNGEIHLKNFAENAETYSKLRLIRKKKQRF